MSLTLLPKAELTLRQLPDGRIVVGAHRDEAGLRHYKIFSRSELPNELVSMDDLRHAGIA